MAEVDATERKDGTERRVYMLPANLLERLRAYQVSQGIASEAEAARRLLDTGLQLRDTASDILNTLEAKFAEERDLRVLASEILAKHALITRIIFEDDSVWFRLNNGERGRITSAGKLYFGHPEAQEDDWNIYNFKPTDSKRVLTKAQFKAVGGDLDDEIPF